MTLAVPAPPPPVVTRHRHRRPPVPVATLLDIAAGLATATDLQPPSPGEERSGVRLVATDAYEAWLLAWPPGSSIEPHDHGDAHGAFVVVAGEVLETPIAERADRRVVLVCNEGYASSLAAAGLLDLGLADATDLDGGVQAWLQHQSIQPKEETRR